MWNNNCVIQPYNKVLADQKQTVTNRCGTINSSDKILYKYEKITRFF